MVVVSGCGLDEHYMLTRDSLARTGVEVIKKCVQVRLHQDHVMLQRANFMTIHVRTNVSGALVGILTPVCLGG